MNNNIIALLIAALGLCVAIYYNYNKKKKDEKDSLLTISKHIDSAKEKLVPKLIEINNQNIFNNLDGQIRHYKDLVSKGEIERDTNQTKRNIHHYINNINQINDLKDDQNMNYFRINLKILKSKDVFFCKFEENLDELIRKTNNFTIDLNESEDIIQIKLSAISDLFTDIIKYIQIPTLDLVDHKNITKRKQNATKNH